MTVNIYIYTLIPNHNIHILKWNPLYFFKLGCWYQISCCGI